MNIWNLLKQSDLIALVNRLSIQGEVEERALMTGIGRLERRVAQEPSVFDRLDDKIGVGMSGWPPTGPWPNNPQAKEVQTIKTEDLEGAL